MPGSEEAAGLPRWDLSPSFPGFDSDKFKKARDDLSLLLPKLEALIASAPDAEGPALGQWLRTVLYSMEEASVCYGSLSAYCQAVYTTDTADARAMAELNKTEEAGLPLRRASVSFRNALKAHEEAVRALLAADPYFADYRYLLEEELLEQSRQMPAALEDLAADLSRSGAEAWSRLQESLSSNASCAWGESGAERKTVVELRNLAYAPERALRQKAFRKEMECWKAVEIPMAAALNGVKGANVSLDARRGWKDALERAAFQSRMESATLEALVCALESSQGVFRRYLGAKARLIGLPRLSFYDLFAPVGGEPRGYRWEEARDFIVERFSGFDPDMGEFAARAFRENWIDASPRPGKVGGAYCTDLPNVRQSRVLCNYEGSFYSVVTLAHELGHAYHSHCVRDLPLALTDYPMTLAETASTFAETIVFDDALKRCAPPERAGLLDMSLRDSCQVITDILSRFYFERAVFSRRAEGELSPSELCGLMLDAQRRTYGDGLDPEGLHPYMWAAKGHYYYADISFYNYPYAFGQLFALALYARFRREGPLFASAYRGILRRTGMASCESVAAEAGFDIRDPEFWLSGMSVFESQVAEFERLSGI